MVTLYGGTSVKCKLHQMVPAKKINFGIFFKFLVSSVRSLLMCLLKNYTVAGLEGKAKYASIRASFCVDSNEE